jgi:AraC family transcriptional regulator, regulatory protein of adaptative response / methylated-DNA-[protein]-cysteine methyltransferase
MSQKPTTYNIIAGVIKHISDNPKSNFSLEQLADFAHLSPTQLQKTFTDWCGVSPKQFQRYLSVEHAKSLLAQNKTTLQTSSITGLSSQGRLHDLFVDIEAMTPGEYKNGGENLTLHYSLHESSFGRYLIASTPKGICNILFIDLGDDAGKLLQARWPNATLVQTRDMLHAPVIQFFSHQDHPAKIKLNLHGTNYQLKVWQALLTIPEGQITSYGVLAKQIGGEEAGSLAARALGRAIGDNPVGYLIPCHRVLKSTGQISGYRWGVERKQAILVFESSKANHD